MQKRLFAAALVVVGALLVPESAHAHGGQYRGPSDTVPPGGQAPGTGGSAPVGPSTPVSPTAPTTPGGPSGPQGGSGPLGPISQSGGGDLGPDLTGWSFWWEFNKAPYLDLKNRIHTPGTITGNPGFFLGQGDRTAAIDRLRPTAAQIHGKVVPALLAILDGESNPDIVTACLIALAKIGDIPDENGESILKDRIEERLGDPEAEVVETAAVALGILGHERSIPTLFEILGDSPAGRKLVDRGEVPWRARAFAAFGLGVIGSRIADREREQEIVRVLTDTLESDDSRNRDIQVACLISLGLVPLDTIGVPDDLPEGELGPEVSRTAQLDYLLGFLDDSAEHKLVRAHVPTALCRLLTAPGMPPELRDRYKSRIAEALLKRLGRRNGEEREVVQSAALALGLLGDADDDPIDRRIRAVLAAVPKEVKDAQARSFSLIAMASIAGNGTIDAESDAGIAEAHRYLVGQFVRGKSRQRPWAGLAIGVLGNELARSDRAPETVRELALVLRTALAEERNPEILGALALGTALLGDAGSIEQLLQLLARLNDDTARGYVAVALGLLGERAAVEPIQRVLRESKYRPELLRQAAIALGLLGDKDVVDSLRTMLSTSKTLACQAAVSGALGFIGDRRSIDPLLAMLENKQHTPLARAFAVAALGIVADDDPLPWNSAIGIDLNYRASTATLNLSTGTGVLNIL
jgi:HEAT repeat protein